VSLPKRLWGLAGWGWWLLGLVVLGAVRGVVGGSGGLVGVLGLCLLLRVWGLGLVYINSGWYMGRKGGSGSV